MVTPSWFDDIVSHVKFGELTG